MADERLICMVCDILGAPTEGYVSNCRNCGGIVCFGHMHHEYKCRGPLYDGPEQRISLADARKTEVILATIGKEA